MFKNQDAEQIAVDGKSEIVIDQDPEHDLGEYRIRAVDGLKYLVQRKVRDVSPFGTIFMTWMDAGFGLHDTIDEARQAFEHLMRNPIYLGKTDD